MHNPFRPIAISLIPTFRPRDVARACYALLKPWDYFNPSHDKKLTQTLAAYFKRTHVFLFEEGRWAEYFLLKALGIGAGDEVIIQAFTCAAVPDAVIKTGAKPVYADIDATLNLDPASVEEKVSSRTKALIVQHTFGTPARIKELQAICRRRRIILIEDCAHGLGNTYETQRLGTFGDAAFLSFGRDKVVSGVCGGAVALDDDAVAEKLLMFQEDLPARGSLWAARQLFYPVFMFLVLNLYSFFWIGKILHRLLRASRILPPVITPEEKKGKMPEPHGGPMGARAYLTLAQFHALDTFIVRRKQLARYYAAQLDEEFLASSSYLRYSMLVEDQKNLRAFAAARNVTLGDWYDSVVAPHDVLPEAVGYEKGSCPVAELVSRRIVNLPTNPTLTTRDAERVIDIIHAWKSKK